MKDLLNNAWVVGTATGLVSGLLVFWLTSLLISKKKDREYRQQISNANREIVYSIRSGIPEGSLPTREVIEALIHSTARRYEVQSAELYQTLEITEELVKEVMDSSFLSAAKKSEYCAALLPLGRAVVDLSLDFPVLRESEIIEMRQERHRIKLKATQLESFFAAILGLLGALAGAGIATKRLLLDSALNKFHALETAGYVLVCIGFILIAGKFVLGRMQWNANRKKVFSKDVQE